MAKTSSIYDHFIILLPSVTLTTNLPEQVFQINNWVKFMAQTSSIYDHFIIWPSNVALTFNLPKQIIQTALKLHKENTVPNHFEIHA